MLTLPDDGLRCLGSARALACRLRRPRRNTGSRYYPVGRTKTKGRDDEGVITGTRGRVRSPVAIEDSPLFESLATLRSWRRFATSRAPTGHHEGARGSHARPTRARRGMTACSWNDGLPAAVVMFSCAGRRGPRSDRSKLCSCGQNLIRNRWFGLGNWEVPLV